MAKYPQGITSFIPTYQPFQLDWNVLAQNVQLKQSRYDKNWESLNNVYGSLYNADVSNPESQKVKDNLLKQIDFNVRRVTGMDLSLKQNVTQAQQIFKPFYENTNLVADIVRTSEYKSEFSKGKSFATSKNKTEHDMYWGGGLQYLGNKMEEFKSLPFDQLSSFEKFEYVPYVNTDKVMREIQKEMGNVKIMQKNGSYWVTTQNGELLKQPLQDRFRQALASDPRVMDVYNVEAYNMGEAKIRNKMSEDPNLSRQDAERIYLNEELVPVRNQQQKALKNIKTEKETVQKKIDDLQIKSKNNPTKDVDNSLQQYEQYLSDLEQMEESMTATLETLTGNVTSTGNTEGGSSLDPEDLKSLRYGVDVNLASLLLQGDINKTAESMSQANFEQTYKADEFAKTAFSKRLELDNYQKKKFIDASAKTGRFPYLFTDKNGQPVYIPWADERSIETKKAAQKAYEKELADKIKSGEWENTPDGPRPSQINNYTTSKNIQGAVPGSIGKDDINYIIDENAREVRKGIKQSEMNMKSILKNMLNDGTATPAQVYDILNTGKSRYEQRVFNDAKEQVANGTLSVQDAYALIRAKLQAPYQTELEKEAGVNLDPRLGKDQMGREHFNNVSEEEQFNRISKMLAPPTPVDQDGVKVMSSSSINKDQVYSPISEKYEDWELGYVIDNYKAFVKQNHELMSEATQLKNQEIFNLSYDIDDYQSIEKSASEANAKLAMEETALLIDYGNKVGGNTAERAHLMNIFDPILNRYRTASYEEYVRGTLNMYNPQQLEKSHNLTLSGMATNFAKGFGMGAVSGTFMESVPAWGTVGHLLWSTGTGLVTMLTPAAVDAGEDLLNTYYYDDDGEIFVEGMPAQREISGYDFDSKGLQVIEDFSADLLTFKGRGNNLSHEYNAYLKEIDRLYEEEELKTRLPGTQNFEDANTLSSGFGKTTMTSPSIRVNQKMPTTQNYKAYFSQVKPSLKGVEIKAESDGDDLENVSVHGVSEADYEKSSEEFGNEELTDLANLVLTDLVDFPNKDEDNKLNYFDIAISPISKNSTNQAAIVVWPNEKYIDQKLSLIYPESDDKDKKANLKIQWLNKNQGLAMNVPLQFVENTDLYNNQFKDEITQRLSNEEVVSYDSPYPGYRIDFQSVSGDNTNLIKVIKYFPTYDVFTGETIINRAVVEEAILGVNAKKVRNYFLNDEVPSLVKQENARFQQFQSQSQTKE